MKKVVLALLVLSSVKGFAELPVLQTRFRKAPVETVTQYAGQNDSEAQVELALRYYAGYQVKQNSQEAFKWMSAAAESGNSDAQNLLSRMYSEGIGVKADQLKSETWFAKALVNDPENIDFQQQYKNLLLTKKPKAAHEFLQLCANAGYTPAFVEYWRPVATNFYQRGNYKEAAKIFQQLAAKEDPSSMYGLAAMYSQGLGGLPEDVIEAFDLYSKAAARNHPEAQYELAAMFEDGKGTARNLDEAAGWYEKSARNGNVAAQYKVAESEFAKAAFWQEQASLESADEELHRQDMLKYRQKIRSAVDWYGKAAAGNHSGAQYMMGRLYASGEEVPVDSQKAVQYYELAAGQGNAEALFYLGLMYHAGLGVEKDIGKAVSTYERAAEQGSRAAMFYLGNCYCYGIGVDQNARKGELIYRNKALDGVQAGVSSESGTPEVLKNTWVLRAAKEYGALLWRRASSEKEMDEAGKWMSLAARGGDSEAGTNLVQMTARASGKGPGRSAADISGHPVDPRSDAVARRRDPSHVNSYLLENIKEIYPDFQPARIITAVQAREDSQSLNGDKLWELYVKYQCPSVRRAVGLKGVLLMGVEFQDRVTGEKYWAFNEAKDPDAAFTGGAFTDVSMFVDLSRYPNLRIRNWAVAYGHLFDGDQVLAVLDERSKSGATGSLDQMIAKNRFSAEAVSKVVATVNITGTEQSSTIAAENKAKSDESKSSDSSSTSSENNNGGLTDLLDPLFDLVP